MTFDDATRTFSADSIDNAEAGTYTIEVTASYADGTSVIDLFDYTLNSCDLTGVAITDVNYDIYSSSTTFTVSGFTLSDASCPDPTYTSVEQSQAGLPTFITNFDGPTLTFTIDSSDNTEAATYIIELTGEYADGTTAT